MRQEHLDLQSIMSAWKFLLNSLVDNRTSMKDHLMMQLQVVSPAFKKGLFVYGRLFANV